MTIIFVLLIYISSIVIVYKISKTKLWLSGGYLLPIVLNIIIIFRYIDYFHHNIYEMVSGLFFGPLGLLLAALLFTSSQHMLLKDTVMASMSTFLCTMSWASLITIGFKILKHINPEIKFKNTQKP